MWRIELVVESPIFTELRHEEYALCIHAAVQADGQRDEREEYGVRKEGASALAKRYSVLLNYWEGQNARTARVCYFRLPGNTMSRILIIMSPEAITDIRAGLKGGMSALELVARDAYTVRGKPRLDE